ncbi:uncharacterized protein LOC121370548 isoform X1 [Gigantopelta aegis]|uniref:uncharacterized protein LOC121370548 isoform X1 n=1 Tax=Gigantopelta aegis TaxID=1735272 RepID=UPI001B887C2E|nr:uncharacterized protein LOC121370548 isoform X1 [Gigantopelta aegis]
MALTPTLCGLAYDWEYLERERNWTPYRVPSAPAIRLLKEDFHALGYDDANGSYFDYLHSYYLKQSYSACKGLVPSPHIHSRCQSTFTWYVPVRDRDPTAPGVKCEGHPSCTLSLPSLSRNGQHWVDDDDDANHRLPDSRIKWVDALNAWVSEKEYTQGKPYITFVNTPPRVEKYCPAHVSSKDREGKQNRCENCYRFQMHMHKFNSTTDINSIPYLRRAINTGLQQKSSIQNRTAAEIAERRKSRKAYSTPAYNSDVRRTRIVRFQPPHSPVPTPTISPPEVACQEEQKDEDEELKGVEAKTNKETEHELAECPQDGGKDEADCSRQLESIALDTLVSTDIEEVIVQESQITPDIKGKQTLTRTS